MQTLLQLSTLCVVLVAVSSFPQLFKKQPNAKFEWKDCGSKEVTLEKIEINPHPVVIPGTVSLSIAGKMKRNLNGGLKTSVNFFYQNPRMKLPCLKMKINGKPLDIGSCVYEDTCEHMFKPYVEHNGCNDKIKEVIGCDCPFQLKTLDLDLENIVLDFSQVSQKEAAMMAGNFEVKVETQDEAGPIACVSVIFSIDNKVDNNNVKNNNNNNKQPQVLPADNVKFKNNNNKQQMELTAENVKFKNVRNNKDNKDEAPEPLVKRAGDRDGKKAPKKKTANFRRKDDDEENVDQDN